MGLAALLCALPLAYARGQPEGAVAPEKSAESKRGFLWEVASPTGKVHLFGSIHLATEDCYPLPATVESAFDDSEQLVVEVDVGEERQAEIAMMMMARGTLPAEESLADHIPVALAEQLADYLEGAGIPAATFDRFKPWLVALTVAVVEAQKLGLDPALGIERYFLDKAKGTKRVLELESIEEQLDLFDQLPAELQQQFLRKTLLEIGELRETMVGAIAAWKSGDSDALQELLFQSLGDAPELKPIYDKLFAERNVKMAETIAGYLGTDSRYFVLVGAGHLVGDDGIVALLEARGFRVKRR